jgi:hypothetical protein
MPMPTAIYMAALEIWIFVVCTIWCSAGLMWVVPRTRSFAWSTSVAAAATFPFVFAYQFVTLPVVFTLLLGAFALERLVDPASLGGGTTKNPVVIIGFISAISGSTFITFVASVFGFVDGWRTGWGLARGRPLNEILSYTMPRRWLNRLMSCRR